MGGQVSLVSLVLARWLYHCCSKGGGFGCGLVSIFPKDFKLSKMISIRNKATNWTSKIFSLVDFWRCFGHLGWKFFNHVKHLRFSWKIWSSEKKHQVKDAWGVAYLRPNLSWRIETLFLKKTMPFYVFLKCFSSQMIIMQCSAQHLQS